MKNPLSRWLSRRRDPDAELREELAYHLDRRAELDKTNPTAARRQFGNVTQTQEEMRTMRIPIWLDGLRQDLAYAARTFTRTPGFTLASVVALALGIGAVTAVFSVVDPLLFRPLPYKNADQIVSVGMSAPIQPSEWLLGPDYIEWRDKPSAIESWAAVEGTRNCDLTEGEPVRLTCGVVESTFLNLFGIQPFMGRGFTKDEDVPNARPVGLISYELWQGHFGGAPVIGHLVEMDGQKREVIGVLPKRFEFPGLRQVDWLVPLQMDVKRQLTRQVMVILGVFGRMKPGATVDQVRESLRPLFNHAMDYVPPQFRKEVNLKVSGFRERQVRDFRTASLVLLGSVLGVLLVACANVANLMLARGATREREMAVRAAIGASRTRLLRQTLTENLFLSGAAGIAGVGLGYLLLAIFRGLAPQGVPLLATASIDLRVLSFALALSVLAGTLAGLAPALRLPSPESLTGTRATGVRKDWLRQTLAAAQIAISLVLLAGSGLLIQSLWRIQQIDLGVDTGQILFTHVALNDQRYPTLEKKQAFYLQLEDRLKHMPGAAAVALSTSVPPATHNEAMILSRIEKEGQPLDQRAPTGGMVNVRNITPVYFNALRIPIVRGRPFTEEDRNSTEGLIIVDEALAHRLYPSGTAVGKRIRPGGNGEWFTIVGVARNARNGGLFDSNAPEYYVLLRTRGIQLPRPANGTWDRGRMYVIIRTSSDVRAIAPLIRAEINRLDPKIPVEIQSLDTEVRQLAARPRFNAMLLALFAAIALALAAIGLAGVVSYLVVQRTQELGVRMALGATPSNVRSLVLNQSLKWILAGAATGLAFGLIATRGIKSMLYGVEPNDPWIIGGVTATLIAVGVLASWLPARRAARLDPMVALRHD
ncbi:MAG TPA: ABC transporter permease [Bryobacteraceae bacterium]|jgi:predicted permease